MRRIALYSDIHANLAALDAVLDDIEANQIDERYCLGDLVGYGPDPAGVIARVRGTGDPVIQGNYDRGVGGRLGDCGCYYATEQARSDGVASYEFTVRATNADEAAYLAALRSEIRLEHEAARIILCHGSPRRINEYLLPDRTDAQLLRLAAEADADVVCCGHVHVPYHRAVEGSTGAVHYVNSGSVGKPKDGDSRACWVELALGSESDVSASAVSDAARAMIASSGVWLGVSVHRVDYDITSVVRAMGDAGLPATLGEALQRA